MVYKGSNISLGRLANKNLRKLKKEGHHYFDILCKNGLTKRSDPYYWLSKQLQIPKEKTHIGMFDE